MDPLGGSMLYGQKFQAVVHGLPHSAKLGVTVEGKNCKFVNIGQGIVPKVKEIWACRFLYYRWPLFEVEPLKRLDPVYTNWRLVDRWPGFYPLSMDRDDLRLFEADRRLGRLVGLAGFQWYEAIRLGCPPDVCDRAREWFANGGTIRPNCHLPEMRLDQASIWSHSTQRLDDKPHVPFYPTGVAPCDPVSGPFGLDTWIAIDTYLENEAEQLWIGEKMDQPVVFLPPDWGFFALDASGLELSDFQSLMADFERGKIRYLKTQGSTLFVAAPYGYRFLLQIAWSGRTPQTKEYRYLWRGEITIKRFGVTWEQASYVHPPDYRRQTPRTPNNDDLLLEKW